MALRRVVLQVVKFQRSVLLDGYAFPVALSCRTLLAWKFPVEQSVVGVDRLTVLIGLLAVEEGQDVDAAVALRQGLLRTGEGCEGRHHIWEVDDVVERLHGYAVGLVHDERHADAAFVELCLSASESGIAVEQLQWGLHGCAVIRSEDDECVVAELQLIQGFQQSADGCIHVGNERGISLVVHIPRFVVIPRGVVDDVWLVGCIVGKIEEERMVPVALDEADGIIGRDIGVVLHVLVVLVCLDVDELVVVEAVVGIIIR